MVSSTPATSTATPMTDTFESDFWGNCCNTFNEEWKQLLYMDLMGLTRSPTWRTPWTFDMHGWSVIDIGGGPSSILLKCENLKAPSIVVDPLPMPEWVLARYASINVWVASTPAEKMLEVPAIGNHRFDLALIYNCLQHCEDPAKVIENALTAADRLAMFEWINIPPHEGHPHMLTAEALNRWVGRPGRVVPLNGQNECFGEAWVLTP